MAQKFQVGERVTWTQTERCVHGTAMAVADRSLHGKVVSVHIEGYCVVQADDSPNRRLMVPEDEIRAEVQAEKK